MPTDIVTSKEIAKTSGNTASDGSGTEYRFLIDAQGHLQLDIITAPAEANSAAILAQLQDWDFTIGADFLANVPFGTPDNVNYYEMNIDALGHLQVDVLTDPVISHITDSIRIGDGTDLLELVDDGHGWAGDQSGIPIFVANAAGTQWRNLTCTVTSADGNNLTRGLHTIAGLHGFNGTNWDRLRSDPITNVLRIINAEHAEIHEQHHYFVSDIDTDIDIATPKYWLIRAPNSSVRVHFTWEMETQNASLIELFEAPAISNYGVALTEHNNDRNSANTSDLLSYRDPTVTGDGILIYHKRLVSDKKSGGFVKRSHEIILDQAGDYLFKITTDADDNEANIFMEYYEE